MLVHFLKMRDLKDFSKSEWLRLLPLQHALKEVRNDMVQRVFLKRLPEALPRFLQDNAMLENKNIILVVAFEQPWVLELLLEMAKGRMPNAALLVFDNS